MACTLINSFPFACRDSNGGVQEMKIKVFNSALIDAGIAETSGTVTMSSSALTGWKTYYCEKQTASATDAGTTNVQNGTSMYTQTVNFIYNKLQVAFRNDLKVLAQNSVWISMKDRNGTSWLFGWKRGMDLTTSSSETGTNFEDRSGYVLTFTGGEPEPMPAISNYAALIDA